MRSSTFSALATGAIAIVARAVSESSVVRRDMPDPCGRDGSVRACRPYSLEELLFVRQIAARPAVGDLVGETLLGPHRRGGLEHLDELVVEELAVVGHAGRRDSAISVRASSILPSGAGRR